MKEWLTAAEVARLPGIGAATPQGVNKIAERNGWQRRQAQGSSRAWEYHVTALPAPARANYLARTANAVSPRAARPRVGDGAQLADHQRQRMEARLALLHELDGIAARAGVNQAIKAMVDLAARGGLPAHLQALVPVANARTGESGRTLSRRTLLRWRSERQHGALALAPRDAYEISAPAWGEALLRAYAQPQKPSLYACMEHVAADLPDGAAMPSYDQARRFLKRLSVVDGNRGRMGPRALKNLRAFTRRDLSELEPLDLALMDGHQFDAEVAHPVHGRPFRPEITSVIDAVTRRVIGWSIGLAESQHAVMDALRHAAVTHGIAAILYVDRGSGYEGELVSAPVTGLLARLGTRHETSLPYNSQARGLIERLHQSLWVRAAKTLPTYMGADMDAEAKQVVHVLTRRAVQAAARSPLVPWREFVGWAQQHVDAYNARPHRGLGKHRDPVTAQMRHLSPDEAWEAWLAAGGTPQRVDEAEAADLFRPVRELTTHRGEVRLFGNLYFNRDLEHRTGERVMVAYDIHDPSRVWVRDAEGRLLCEAALDGNRASYFPRSVVEQAREQRAKGRARRLAIQLGEVQAELGPRTIDSEAMPLDAETEALAAEQLQRMLPPPANDPAPPVAADDARPIFQTDEDFATWCLAHPDRMLASDREWLNQLLVSPSFRRLIGLTDAEDAQSA